MAAVLETTAREALFDAMVSGGWATKSDGDVEAPTGQFALVINEKAELSEIRQAFSDILEMYGTIDDDELIGNYVITTDSDGNIGIRRYLSRDLAKFEFNKLALAFAKWGRRGE